MSMRKSKTVRVSMMEIARRWRGVSSKAMEKPWASPWLFCVCSVPMDPGRRWVRVRRWWAGLVVHKGSVTLLKAQRVAVAVVRLERELYPLSLAMTIGDWCVLTMVLKVV